MSQPRGKHPLDMLQGMINGILIETGRALRGADKEGGKTLVNANTRLRTTIPAAIENFHQLLDELESDIVRAKSVLHRDLDTLRAQRFAAENPTVEIPQELAQEIPQEIVKTEPLDIEDQSQGANVPIKSENTHPTPQSAVKEEPSPTVGMISADNEQHKAPKQEPPDENDLHGGDSKVPEKVLPPNISDANADQSNTIGLSTNEPGTTTEATPVEPHEQDSTMEELFGDLGEDGNNDGGGDLHLDGVDFSIYDANNDTQTQDQAQIEVGEFDLSNFGNTQEFNMDLQTSNDKTFDTDNIMMNEQGGDDIDDLLNTFGAGTGGGDETNLDMSMDGAEDHDFDDDMWYGAGDGNGSGDGNIGDGVDIEDPDYFRVDQ